MEPYSNGKRRRIDDNDGDEDDEDFGSEGSPEMTMVEYHGDKDDVADSSALETESPTTPFVVATIEPEVAATTTQPMQTAYDALGAHPKPNASNSQHTVESQNPLETQTVSNTNPDTLNIHVDHDKQRQNTDTSEFRPPVSADFLSVLQRILRLRLTGQASNVKIKGYDEELNQLTNMLTASMTRGESNSTLIIGTRGAGKTALVNAALDSAASMEVAIARGFKIVRLNGLIHSEDITALKEIARQIQINVPDLVEHLGSDNMQSESVPVELSSFSTGDTVRALLAALKSGTREQNQCLVIVLDEFDLFAHSGKQSLLYTLFDTAQAGSTPLAIIGITSRFDAEDLLEKRVLSRFSRRKIYLHHRLNFSEYVDVFRESLNINPIDGFERECNLWNESVLEFVKASSVQRELQQLHDTNLDFRALHRLAIHPICSISLMEPFPSFKHLFSASVHQKQDSKAALILSLSLLELCLIIATNNVILLNGLCNFEIAYQQYKDLVMGSSNKVDYYNKPVAFKAFEHLTDLEIIRYASGSLKHTPKRYRKIHLMVEPVQIEDALKRFPSLPLTIRNWLQTR